MKSTRGPDDNQYSQQLRFEDSDLVIDDRINISLKQKNRQKENTFCREDGPQISTIVEIVVISEDNERMLQFEYSVGYYLLSFALGRLSTVSEQSVDPGPSALCE